MLEKWVFEKTKSSVPLTGNTRLLLRFYVTIFSNFKQDKPKFFFRSKNPENLRGFCPPNRK